MGFSLRSPIDLVTLPPSVHAILSLPSIQIPLPTHTTLRIALKEAFQRLHRFRDEWR